MKALAQLFLLICLLLGFLFFAKNSYAHPGNTASDGCHYCWTNCDSWGEVYGERHCHGGGSYNYSAPVTPTCPTMSYYNSITGQCECYSGYIVSGGRCISEYTYCTDEYGYHSTYDSLNDTCKCSYGYTFNNLGTKCISEDEACQEQFGFNSKATILGDKCECKSGYVWQGSTCVYDTTYLNNHNESSQTNYIVPLFQSTTPSPTNIATVTPSPSAKPTKKPSPTPIATSNPTVAGIATEQPTPTPTQITKQETQQDPPDGVGGTIIGLGGAGAIGYGLYKYANKPKKTSFE